MIRILRGCAYGTAFGMCSPSDTPLYVCALTRVCTAVGMCSPSHVPAVASICMCVDGARHVRIEWCNFRAEVCVLVLAQCSQYIVRVVYPLCVACVVRSLYASGVERAPRACLCSVFGMGRLSNAPIARECTCKGVHPVRARVQCLA